MPNNVVRHVTVHESSVKQTQTQLYSDCMSSNVRVEKHYEDNTERVF